MQEVEFKGQDTKTEQRKVEQREMGERRGVQSKS